ncbi:MAG: FAD-dependent oxidoreductase [Clostridiales bacterium]|nr:FAD-dependent oxidoreductase [Clostridiales bacterium]
MSENYVLVGNGCAAIECAKSLRENGYSGNIHLLSDLSVPAYNPMLITYYAAGKIEYDTMFPYGNNMDLYKRYNIIPHFGSPVVKLDTKEQYVENSEGFKIHYDKALIATGSSPIIPSAFKNVSDHVYTLRTLEDGVKFRDLLRGQKKRVLVVGASMVGIKAVEALIENGFEVYLADFAEYIFPMIAHKNCSIIIQEILKSKNVKLRFGTAIERVEKDKDSLVAYFTDGGPTEKVDSIVICTGVRPNVSFLDPNQVEIDNGIVVNEYMETSVAGLYAAGDVSQASDLLSGEKRIIGLWANARYQGRTAGANMAGKRTKYLGALPHNITHFMEHDFVGVGDINEGDHIYEEYDEENYSYCRLVWKDGKLIGVNILNIPEISGILKNYIIKGLVTDYKDGLSKFANDSLALMRLYNKYPSLENKFLEMRVGK